MICPNCRQKALRLSQFMGFNPFKHWQCACCGATLRVTLLTRCLCVLTFCVVLASFIYTFPQMHHVIHSQPNATVRSLLDMFLPFVVIPVQVTLLFLPVVIHTWLRGRFQIVAQPQEEETGLTGVGQTEPEADSAACGFTAGMARRESDLVREKNLP